MTEAAVQATETLVKRGLPVAFHACVAYPALATGSFGQITVSGSSVDASSWLGQDIGDSKTSFYPTVAAGSVIYLVLIALLALGVATIIRDTAASIGAMLALLYLSPIAAQLIQDPAWRRHIQQIAPMTAGLAIQTTRNLHNLPIAPWAGLGVLAAWAAAALVAGGLLLWLRDA